MSDSFTISPLGLANIPPVAFQQLTTSTSSVTVLSAFVGSEASSIVDVSGLGQLLSAVAESRSRLEALQASDDTSQAGVLANAEGFVDAFNKLLEGSSSLQNLFGSLTGTLLNDQLALSLNELASAAIASGAASLASLQDIGIVLETTAASASAAPGFALRVDENALSAAVTSDPAGTAALLDQASQSLLTALNGFELQAASAAVTSIDLTPLGTATVPTVDLASVLGLNTTSSVAGAGIAPDLLQFLSADTVLNDVPVSDLDLAAVGLDAATLLTETAARSGALNVDALNAAAPDLPLNADLTTLTAAGALAVGTMEEAAPTVTARAVTANPAAAPDSADPAGIAAPSLVPVTTTAALSPSQSPSQSPVSGLGNTEAIAAERAASAASITLQNLLANPALQAIRKHFDPAYSALIAAAHQHDFILPEALVDAKGLSLVDTPAAVLGAERVRALADYRESVEKR